MELCRQLVRYREASAREKAWYLHGSSEAVQHSKAAFASIYLCKRTEAARTFSSKALFAEGHGGQE